MKMRLLCLFLLALLVPVVAQAKDKESVYAHIQETKTIRCGYTVWDPLFTIDAKTGEKGGIFHDVMEEIGKRLDIKIVWQEELGWDTSLESVKNGRVDMACAGYWLNAPRIQNALSSTAQLYSPLYVWMREDDKRVLKIEELNSNKFSVAEIDGSAENQNIAIHFQKVKIVSLPELDSTPDKIMNLITKKVDFITADISTMKDYMAKNPGKVRNAFPDQPIALFPTVMLLPPDDFRLKDLLDNTLRGIEYDGTLDTILQKYHVEHDYLRNPLPSAR